MGIPLFIPRPSIALALPAGDDVTLDELCDLAGVRCKVSGLSARRPLTMALAKEMCSVKLPGSLSPVWLGIPKGTPKRRALLALGALAYGVFDYAARETLRGLPESRPTRGPGRPRSKKAMSGAERQRRYRQRIRSAS